MAEIFEIPTLHAGYKIGPRARHWNILDIHRIIPQQMSQCERERETSNCAEY